LQLSGANLVFSPKKGNRITIQGVAQIIPAGGVTLTPAAIVAPRTDIVSASVVGSVLTVNFASNHGFTVGSTIFINTPFSGVVNSTVATVPSGTSLTCPTTLSPAGLTSTSGSAGNLYYIYAFMNAGVMTLEASPVGHVTDATTGVEIKSGDNSRSLVGMAAPVAGPAFSATDGAMHVLSWFNRRNKKSRTINNTSGTDSSLSSHELNANFRNFFCTWGDEVVDASYFGDPQLQGSGSDFGLGFDGFGPTVDLFSAQSITATTINSFSNNGKVPLAEGFHYCSIFVSNNSGSNINFNGSGAGGNGGPAISNVMIRG
jgi:hypothetical protein